MSTPAVAPAGPCADPDSAGRLRYWDGQSWTKQPASQAPTDPVVPPAAQPAVLPARKNRHCGLKMLSGVVAISAIVGLSACGSSQQGPQGQRVPVATTPVPAEPTTAPFGQPVANMGSFNVVSAPKPDWDAVAGGWLWSMQVRNITNKTVNAANFWVSLSDTGTLGSLMPTSDVAPGATATVLLGVDPANQDAGPTARWHVKVTEIRVTFQG